MGSFSADRTEVDDDVIDGASEIVVDDVATARRHAGLVFYNSTGLGVQDAAAAAMVLEHLTGTAPRP